MAAPVLPFWMQQRQVKAEAVNESTLKLSAPQLPLYEIEVQPVAGSPAWTAALFQPSPEGAQRRLISQASVPLPHQVAAWEAGFELYRQSAVV